MVMDDQKKQQNDMNELDAKMKSRVAQLLTEHDRALRAAEEYYSQLQRNVMEDHLRLKVRAGRTGAARTFTS